MSEYCVLIVDDEPGMRLGAVRTLADFRFTRPDFNEEIGFTTATAENGGEALRFLETTTPDILILDYKLPDIHGLDILSRVAQVKTPPLTIMITAYASLEVAINATKNGAFDFLAKPFTPDELRNTVRKAAEHVYLERKAQKLEEEKRQVRFQFISVLAHELKSPLAAVEGYLQIMKDRTTGNDMASYDQMIGRSIVRIDGMRKLITDILDLTRIESGQKARTLEEVSLEEIAHQVIAGMEQDTKERKVTVALACPESITLQADRGELEIVFANLLTNAVKYNKEGGSISLDISKDDSGAVISCEDTGIGMTEEEAGRIFVEFTRIKNEKTKYITGSGLGLSIVKKIIDLYQGSIKVESAPDQGSRFIIRLPLTKGENA
jgi:two-component system, sensor histidine kinase and response regulator